MARKRAIAQLKKTVMTPQQSQQAASAGDAPTPRHSTRPTRGIAAQPPVYTEPNSSDDEDYQPAARKGKAKMSAQQEQDSPTEGPPAPRHNTRYQQAQLSEECQDAASKDDNFKEISREEDYPLYKDDLPNAFNGAVDPSLDFISKAPNEVVDNILSYLVLDHDPDRGAKIKAGTYKPVPHVLLSMAAMSRLFYHATEGFARRYRIKHKLDLPKPRIDWSQYPDLWAHAKIHEEKEREKERNIRRSVRIANTPKLETHEFYRKSLWDELRSHCAICHRHCWRTGKLASQVSVCEKCELSTFGSMMNLTDALKDFDLRDYMLIKSRKPGPRAKFLNLPTITYGSEYKPMGYPVYNTVCTYSFRCADVRMLARLVYGDVEKHLKQKEEEKKVRSAKAKRKRVREFKIEYHQLRLEVSTAAAAKRHSEELERLRALDPDDDEDEHLSKFGCRGYFCYHDIGLCYACGDVVGHSHESCGYCEQVWEDRKDDRRTERYFSKISAAGRG